MKNLQNKINLVVQLISFYLINLAVIIKKARRYLIHSSLNSMKIKILIILLEKREKVLFIKEIDNSQNIEIYFHSQYQEKRLRNNFAGPFNKQ